MRKVERVRKQYAFPKSVADKLGELAEARQVTETAVITTLVLDAWDTKIGRNQPQLSKHSRATQEEARLARIRRPLKLPYEGYATQYDKWALTVDTVGRAAWKHPSKSDPRDPDGYMTRGPVLLNGDLDTWKNENPHPVFAGLVDADD